MKNKTSGISAVKKQAGGFSLIECVVAIVVLTTGLLAVAALAGVATQTEVFASRSGEASTIASSKIEELKAGTLVNGGSLTSNTVGYSETLGSNYYCRWQISDGPGGTKRISVVVVPQSPAARTRQTQLDTLVR